MKFWRENCLRFQYWSSDVGSFSDRVKTSLNTVMGGLQRSFSDRVGPSLNAVMGGLRRGFETGSERIRGLKKPISFCSSGTKLTEENALDTKKSILNPQGQYLQTWNKLFLLSCAIALALDPLFFYIPVIDDTRKCLNLDDRLGIIACLFRTFIDAFYIIHMIFQFRTAFVAPSSRVFGRGELIEDHRAIAEKYLSKYFVIDILSVLPLPQVVIILVIPMIKGPVPLVAKQSLKAIIFGQYVPRIIRIFPLYKQVTRTSGIVTETAWGGAAWNLFLYMLASHILGSFWYLFSIERQDRCWRDALTAAEEEALYCDKNRIMNPTFVNHLNTSCPFINPDDINDPNVFNFGIFFDALQSGVAETYDFPKKFFYCFWWGLRNLSSLGQNLKTSTFWGEIAFAICISIFGLILFSLLIGNMQKYLQSTGVRIEEMRVKRQDAEQWMSHRMLPEKLRERIRRYEQYKWQETRGVEEESLISNLPKDLRRDIKRHLCLDLLKRVPMFEIMDEQLLDAMCDRLKPALYTDKSHIVREGDPVEEMLFIIRGELVSTTTNGGRSGFFNTAHLKAGDFCGEDLLTWALDPQSPSNLPSSTRTVQALTEVEAFALMADDLKFVASQFRRLHSKQFRHTFKYYSVQWQTWGAAFIQAAWRRHCKRKLAKSLREAEDKLQDALAKESETSPSLGATLFASHFAAIALRALRQNASQSTGLPPRVPRLLPQKPAEPDFTAEDG